jgi:hypothetical protein
MVWLLIICSGRAVAHGRTSVARRRLRADASRRRPTSGLASSLVFARSKVVGDDFEDSCFGGIEGGSLPVAGGVSRSH